MAQETTNLFIANRYQVESVIGRGGMGVVYKSLDRLTQRVVALKQMLSALTSGDEADTEELDTESRMVLDHTMPLDTMPSETITDKAPETLMHDSPFFGIVNSELLTTPGTLRLALSREFETLASLRHPHIIEVLDYGFDHLKQPFFTMPLLDDPKTITEAGKGWSIADKVRLLTEMLQAIAYLHHRGIIHRDLKPDNALVTQDGVVKVLDFGLAVLRDQLDRSSQDDDTLVGTFAYMAPELLHGAHASEASDMYAVGMIAYELFSGEYPHKFENFGELVNAVIHDEPDTDNVDVSYPLRDWLDALLVKDPQQRLTDANDAIERLNDAINQQAPIESKSIRESYLQSAQFVGRGDVLKTLVNGLKETVHGHGSTWLIGGGRGVGKSRVLEELRIRALINGVTVLRASGISGGGLSYQLWRDPIKRLVLSTEINATQANILKELLPDIEAILQRKVPPFAGEDTGDYVDQISSTILTMFQSHVQPILLLLDDLHFAEESLSILQKLNQIVADRALMIVGTYSTDSKRDMLAELPLMQPIQLERLQDDALEALSVSMIGRVAQRADVKALLKREAEGNVYFLIEVIRALAEEAGRLRHIRDMSLPRNINVGSISDVLQRRLDYLPDHYQTVLRALAIAGRNVDISLLKTLCEDAGIDDEEWLTIATNSSVLERQDTLWRFTHDKLREVALQGSDEAARSTLHQTVAEGMEKAYPDTPEQASTLSYHWRHAGNAAKELHFSLIAGDYSMRIDTYQEAVRQYERALTRLLEQDDAQHERTLIQTYIKLAEALRHTGNYPQARVCVEQGLARIPADEKSSDKAQGISELADILWGQGKFEESRAFALEAYTLATAIQHYRTTIRAISRLGILAQETGDYTTAQKHYEDGLILARSQEDEIGLTSLTNNSGMLAFAQGNLDDARTLFEESLELSQSRGERVREASTLNNLGAVAGTQGDLDAAARYFEQGLTIARSVGERRLTTHALENLGFISLLEEDFISAKRYMEDSLAIAESIGNSRNIAHILLNLSDVAKALEDSRLQRDYIYRGIEQSINANAAPVMLEALTKIAHLEDNHENAIRWLGQVIAHQATQSTTADEAQKLLESHKTHVDEAQAAALLKEGAALDLHETLSALLEGHHAARR